VPWQHSPTAHARLRGGAGRCRRGELQAVTLSGKPTLIPAAAVKNFAANFNGKLLSASDADYEQARRLWKQDDRSAAGVDRALQRRPPTSRAPCPSPRERELLVAVRGGGTAPRVFRCARVDWSLTCPLMRGVRVDPIARTASGRPAAPGSATSDWEAQQFGLATTMGEISNTGGRGA